MAVYDHVHIRRIKSLPDQLHLGLVAVVPRAEEWVMPVGERASGCVRGEIRAQPLVLNGAGLDRDIAVENYHVPRALVVTVVPLARVAGSRTEVVEVSGSAL